MLLYLLLGLDLALVRECLQTVGEIRTAVAPDPVRALRMRCLARRPAAPRPLPHHQALARSQNEGS